MGWQIQVYIFFWLTLPIRLEALFCLLSKSIYFCTLAYIINFNLFHFVWNVNILGKGQNTFTLQITKKVVTCVAGTFYRLLSRGRGGIKTMFTEETFHCHHIGGVVIFADLFPESIFPHANQICEHNESIFACNTTMYFCFMTNYTNPGF